MPSATPSQQQWMIDDVRINISWKRIKHLYIRIHPPDGRVEVSAPESMPLTKVRACVMQRLNWIKTKQTSCSTAAPALSSSRYESGEMHPYLGRQYRLVVQHKTGKCTVMLNDETICLHCPPHTAPAERKALLEQWYRQQLQQRIPQLLQKWETILGVKTREWRIKRMKTRWGSCNTGAHRIWLNAELIKKPDTCIEYVLVHELVHLLERSHNQRFYRLMDSFLPDWQVRKKRLNSIV
ncbi:M48 family metallopeptidase [Pelobacter seleniigenes]|uniref:M48 family metallopeptidase n=1 Tax=Pelobacter seleniigenes TaxID=407188 RepID=UPI000AA32F59|nr:SprT family zinc-dependent metalloprotease [Pelobacter seleniigenes]